MSDLIFPLVTMLLLYLFYRYLRWRKEMTWRFVALELIGLVLITVGLGKFNYVTIFVCILFVFAFVAARMPDKQKGKWLLDGELDEEVKE